MVTILPLQLEFLPRLLLPSVSIWVVETCGLQVFRTMLSRSTSSFTCNKTVLISISKRHLLRRLNAVLEAHLSHCNIT